MVANAKAGQAKSRGGDACHRPSIVSVREGTIFDLSCFGAGFIPKKIKNGALDFVQQLLIGPFERRSVRRYEGRRSVLLTTGESDEWRSQQAHSADAQHFPSGEKMRIATKVDARHGFSSDKQRKAM